MQNKKDVENFKLTEPVILAFEREKQDAAILKKYKHSKNVRLTIVRIFFILLFIASALYLAQWYFFNQQNDKIADNMSQYLKIDNSKSSDNTSDNVFKVDFDSLKKTNSTCFAWLNIKNTNINYPIIKYTNNDYYLNHSFDNSYNPSGWPFADYKNFCNGYDKNLVIYGHNIKNGSMFGSLKRTLNEDWYSNADNLIIDLYTENGLYKYQVFSVYEIKAETYYTTTTFLSDSAFKTFLNELEKRSFHDFGVELTGTDKILTLSTCSNNNAYRTVLHAKRIQANQ